MKKKSEYRCKFNSATGFANQTLLQAERKVKVWKGRRERKSVKIDKRIHDDVIGDCFSAASGGLRASRMRLECERAGMFFGMSEESFCRSH